MLVSKLKEREVISHFFAKSSTHAQLVQRSAGILQFLIKEKALTDEEMELVWSCTQLDEAICLDFYKVLNEISQHIGYEEQFFFI